MSTKSQFSGIIPSSKRSRITDQHAEISDLPDWAISHILSLLPTKDAVRTSVLSKEWEYKWTSIDHIVFDDEKARENKSKKASFVNFVDRTLLLLQNLQSFCIICCQKYGLSRMKAWISAALSRNVQYLTICYGTVSFVLPRNLFLCYSLRKLVVISHCTLNVPASNCLPHLTTLCLKNIEILNEDSSTDVLKFNFPVLEKLELLEHKWLNVKFVEIHAPKMTSFVDKTYDTGENEYCSIKITGDSLVKFDYSGAFAENIVLSSGSAVTDATLDFNLLECEDIGLLEKNGLQIRMFLKSFSSLKDLELSGGTVENALLQSKLGLSLPIYYRMERLVLISFGNSQVLLELLHAAPSLKFLVIDVLRCNAYDYDAEEYVPSCVVSHLEEVNFIWFRGLIDEFKLVKFFLKNALKLKSLMVKCSPKMPEKKRDEIEKRLCSYPRASPYLTIVVPKKM